MGKISFYEMARVLVEHNGLEPNIANEFVKTMFDIIQERLTIDQQVKVKGLGTFKIVEVEPRESINVNTGERILIEGHSKISFTPDSTMKELINKPFSQFETVVLNDGVNFEDAKTEEQPVAEGERSVVEENKAAFADDKNAFIDEKAVFANEKTVVVEEIQSTVIEEPELPVVAEEEPSAAVEEPGPPAAVEEPEPSAVVEEPEPSAVVEEPEPSAVVEEPEPPVVVEEPEPPVVVEEPEPPVVVEEPEVVEERTSVVEREEIVDDVDEETESRLPSHFKPVLIHLIYIIVVAALAGWGGYWYGKSSAEKDIAANKVVQAPRKRTVVKKVVMAESVVKQDTMRKDSLAAVPSSSVPSVKREETKTVEKIPQDDYAKYAKMDVRVRTGAYVIVGEKGTEKVRKGETVAHLSRRILGEGMECYIEVFNNITADTPLKEGQELKIPELRLKKSLQRKK
ncbi:MAG: HU family DNA-binding protein [Prevotella sp.]|nr:HU family DNA-binding protein [Prevotella sp.]MBO5155751.1 HU family DNA-binding protein [Prevotella sp.]